MERNSHTRPSFTVDAKDFDTIGAILDRVGRLGAEYDLPLPVRMTAVMDMCAAHGNNGNRPLDLAGLLEADDGDFAHDVWGIFHHIDRTTGTLGDCFLPRYAR